MPSAEQVEGAAITAFARRLEADWHVALPDYAALHAFSIDEMEKFWSSAWDFCEVIAEHRGDRILIDGDRMPGARFFPDARLNFARNLLRRQDDAPAIIFRAEGGAERRLSWRQLHEAVSCLAAALRARGVGPGDRCAGYVPNCPEAVIAMLATTAIGAVWTSCSPDFGVRGVLDRFGQVEPKILFSADGYHYNGVSRDSLAPLAGILEGLPSVECAIVFPMLSDAPDTPDGLDASGRPDLSGLARAALWDDVIAEHPAGEIAFESLPFDHPVYILYSSGTTGAPKCIVHCAGGVLLQHLKEQRLHCGIRCDDRVFYFTTCGWMMWNWLVSALACEATLVLYDGSPFHPDPAILFDYADAVGVTFFGTSAKYIDALMREDLRPCETHDLSTVRTLTSTGSPLAPEGFSYVYDKVKPELCLSSIAGGTDIVGCFVGGNPALPVWRGEIQCSLLGMAVAVYDGEGRPVVGEKGELVCTKPFPSMPVGFWNDASEKRYRAAYYERYPGVWHHGDFVAMTERGGMIIYGRSDTTLNPGGVRIGTAEIYREVEACEEVAEAICVGQEWEGDTRIVLFVVLREGFALNEDLIQRIRGRIRENCSPRHVPAKVVAVADIPRTKSGKITEFAVRDVIHGRTVANREALANPEALDLYRGILESEELY